MPTASDRPHGLTATARGCAVGPSGWRYVSHSTTPSGAPAGSVDLTLDTLGRPLRMELRGGSWQVRGAALQLALLLLTFYLSAPAALTRKIGPAELLKLPLLFGRFIKSIYRMKTARNQFLHTPHGADPVSKP